MERGWKAKGRLQEHWATVGGRDGLAEKTGIQPSTLSGYNTGRLSLGRKNAELIARALGVTVFDLGAPTAEEAAERSVAVVDRVAALEAEIARLQRAIDELRPPQGGEA